MDDSNYWNEFYSGASARELIIPSQFAAFVASEFAQLHNAVVDVGCGTGRDTMFFERVGLVPVGIDASQSAIENCRMRAEGSKGRFICAPVSDPNLVAQVRAELNTSDDLLVYARFFLHAIDDDAETAFLSFARELVGASGKLAVEFRTRRDRELSKVTPTHFRRYIDPLTFAAKSSTLGFAVNYFTEGFGYAKYKQDDAHVARFILEPM